MKRSKLAALVAVVVGVLFLFGQPAFCAPAKGKANAGITKGLKLTADQKAKIKAIREDAKKQADAVKADTTLTPDAKKTKLKAIKDDTEAKIKAVLTPEQIAQMEKMRAARQNQGDEALKSLGLTEDQKTKIKAIKADETAQLKAVNEDKTLTEDAKKAKVKEIRKATREKILEVLTPEQREKLKAARSNKPKPEAK